ncbi:MAG: AbrB/MazE/SpoVT family DNA-binding domain-containing protein [Bacillota bacterium]
MSKNLERKITKVGNSFAVTLSQDVLKHLKVTQGDEVKISLEDDGQIMIKKTVKMDFLDQDFYDGLQDLFDNYDDTLKNLVER